MRSLKFLRLVPVLALWLLAFSAAAQINIDGVTDKSTYSDAVTYRVQTQAGFSLVAWLNGVPVAVGVSNRLNRPDYYELQVQRTDLASSAVTTRLVRFLVHASERVGTEWGLPVQVPWPIVQSASAEFVGGQLSLMLPQDFPVGYPIPVVARVADEAGHAVRANGLVAAAGLTSFQLRRGVGSGFLASNLPPGVLNYAPAVGGLSATRNINLEATTTWTPVAGVLGDTTWPAGARVQVTGSLTVPPGVTLTIEAGTIVRLNSGLDITNNGSIVINGTVERPVVFMPTVRSQPWGGFVSKTTGAGTLIGTGVIFTGSGANSSWFGANGNPGSHRVEQGLFYCDGGQQIQLTDAAAISLSGQLGHSRQAGAVTSITLTRFLMQRVTTGGEYTGARFVVNDSAFIECPDDSANFVDGDNDGLYLVDGTHSFTNTLFGWTKDDGIDSGGSGYGKLDYQSCWFEATFHEGNSLSGYKNTFARDTVYLDCGQGIEDGYNAPTGRVDHCLFLVNQSGVRFGDNYPSIGNYDGRMTATNCILLNNHRDLFAYNWRSTGWTNAWGQMFANNNFLTATDTNFPDNFVWDPVTDADRLTPFGAKGRVGVALAVRAGQTSFASFPDGVPVGLSLFCTNPVSVDYSVATTDGGSVNGTLVFVAGELRKFIPLPGNFQGVLRVGLSNPVNADLTGTTSLLFQNLATPATGTVLSPLGAAWRYLDDGSEQGTAWRAPGFDDATWSNGVARLGFGADASATTTIRRTTQAGGVITNFYFRRSIVVTNPADFTSIQFRYQRDDGCIVFLNGSQIFTNNMPPPPITARTFAASTISGATDLMRFWTNTFSASLLQPGTNVIAVEVHQSTATSSDIAWDMELQGLRGAAAPRLNIARLGGTAVLYWNDNSYSLDQSPVPHLGAWTTNATASPVSVQPSDPSRFYRLKK